MTTDLLKPELSFQNNMDLAHKNAWAPFSNYTLQLHTDFHGFKWLISFCACSFQISIIMFIFLYRLTGGDDHADQRGKACLKCFCDTFDSDRCMNSLTRGWMSMCSIVGHGHRVIYLKETRVRTTHAARKMLLCRLEAAKRHLNPGKIFALARISPRSIRSVCVFSPLTWLVIIDNSLCVCACVCVF